MLIIRPIEARDYAALFEIAQESGIGFTSLPVNEALIQQKIDLAQAAFQAQPSQPGNQSYLFVLEDTESGEVLGTSGIEASVGLNDAFYHYHLGKVVHASRELGIHNTVEILTFCNDYTGVSEICTLFLREKARKGLAGRLLSKFRFLFMAQHPERFSDTLIAEMRGVSDDNGKSPFWEWLEAHFFSMDFPTADYLTGIGKKVFIAELMPKYPIYVNLLSKDAQACIGKVHEKTKPALHLLEQEGFRCRGYVDIFDAGPTVEADINNLTTIQNSKHSLVKITNEHNQSQSTQERLVINNKVAGFRACLVPVDTTKHSFDELLIPQECADALQVVDGDTVYHAPCAGRK